MSDPNAPVTLRQLCRALVCHAAVAHYAGGEGAAHMPTWAELIDDLADQFEAAATSSQPVVKSDEMT